MRRAIDRRVQKTKKLLSESLVSLMLEKDFDSISVQDILDRADVGRSTFYSHYEGKEQLLLDGPKNMGIALFADAAPHPAVPHRGGPLPAGLRRDGPDFLPLFAHASQNLNLARAMLGRKSGRLFIEHMQNQVRERIRTAHRGRFGKSRDEQMLLGYYADAAAAAVMAMLTRWIEDGAKLGPEVMARFCGRAVTGMLRSRAP